MFISDSSVLGVNEAIKRLHISILLPNNSWENKAYLLELTSVLSGATHSEIYTSSFIIPQFQRDLQGLTKKEEIKEAHTIH